MLNFVRTPLRRKILNLVIHHPDRDYYVRELAALVGEDPGNCSRELKRFQQEGIVTAARRAKAKFYSINSAYPHLEKIKSLLSIEGPPQKTLKTPKTQKRQKGKSPVLYLCDTGLRKALLGWILQNPGREFYVRELGALIGQDPGNLSRELRVFEEEGLLESYTRAGAKFFRLREDCPLCGEIREYLLR